jgi:hypothetical protein
MSRGTLLSQLHTLSMRWWGATASLSALPSNLTPRALATSAAALPFSSSSPYSTASIPPAAVPPPPPAPSPSSGPPFFPLPTPELQNKGLPTRRMNLFTAVNDALRCALEGDDRVIVFGEVKKISKKEKRGKFFHLSFTTINNLLPLSCPGAGCLAPTRTPTPRA